MISLLIVNYRSARLAAEAVRTARAGTSEPLLVVVVDNSLDPAEAEALRPHADRLIVSTSNRGYGGAINDGRAACEGDLLVVANPDVTFASGSIDELALAVRAGAAVAGPAFFWDDRYEWRLPPGDTHGGWSRVDEVLASRSARWARERDRRRFRQRVAFWSLERPKSVKALSGAVLAIEAKAFDEIGGFDERFPLYFEENDFLRQIEQRRRRIEYRPGARCRHLYNQSAAGSEDAGVAYETSRRRYFEKWNGPFVARLLDRLACSPRVEDEQLFGREPIVLDRLDVIVEASPLPDFGTAAGHFPAQRHVELPPEVWDCYRGKALYLRAVDRESGEVLATYAKYKS
jgi:N-acetylglucosaminyl-diphospho-decaprenol L-rhamnosyltransferase